MPTREQTLYSRARSSLIVGPSRQMDRFNNPPNGNTDLFIPVGHSWSRNTSETSTRQTSVDDMASTRTTTSTSSTAPTSHIGDGLKADEPTSRGRRYIITARNGARARTEASLKHKTTESLRRESIGSGKAVTASNTTSSGKEVSTVSRRSSSQDVVKTQSSADGLAFTSVRMVQTPQDTRPTGDSSRPQTATSSVISRPRYPPTSYRGSVNNAEAARPVCSVPSPIQQEATTAPLFGKVETSKSSDAPAPPHRTGGISRLVRRLSGRQRSAPSTPTTPTDRPPRTPTKQSPAVPHTPRTDTSSSTPPASTPYTSPDVCPSPSQTPEKSKNLRCRRRAVTTSTPASTANPTSPLDPTRSHSHTTTATKTTTKITLPSPTHAYKTPIFFTTCSHTSPPSHRPLNIQPTLIPYTPTLLAHPPFHLRGRLAKSQSIAPILTITGSCCACDYAACRRMEGEVLARYADIRNRLLSRIRMLRVRMNALHRPPKSLSQPKSNAQSNANANANSTTTLGLDSACDSNDESNSDSDSDSDSDGEGRRKTRVKGDALEEEQNINLEILNIEGEIEDLPERQDMDISGVWWGWGAKWGIGTVGIHRSLLGEGDGEQDWDGKGVGDGFGEGKGQGDGMGRDGGQEIRVEEGERGGKGNGGSSDRFLGSDAALGSEAETSTGKGSTNSVNRSATAGLNRWGGKFDDVVVDGRMKLDWIRPDLPKEEKVKEK